jgi:hypothetical protein
MQRAGPTRRQDLQHHARAALADCVGIRFGRSCPVTWTNCIVLSLLFHFIRRPLVWSKRHVHRSRMRFKGRNEALFECFGVGRKKSSSHADQPQAINVGTIRHVYHKKICKEAIINETRVSRPGPNHHLPLGHTDNSDVLTSPTVSEGSHSIVTVSPSRLAKRNRNVIFDGSYLYGGRFFFEVETIGSDVTRPLTPTPRFAISSPADSAVASVSLSFPSSSSSSVAAPDGGDSSLLSGPPDTGSGSVPATEGTIETVGEFSSGCEGSPCALSYGGGGATLSGWSCEALLSVAGSDDGLGTSDVILVATFRRNQSFEIVRKTAVTLWCLQVTADTGVGPGRQDGDPVTNCFFTVGTCRSCRNGP